MNVIQLTDACLISVKRKLREQCAVGSAHLTEAIARGCGYKTNAALQADLDHGPSRARYILFDEVAFRQRLADFGATAPNEFHLPELGHSARYVKGLFEDGAIEIIELRSMRAQFRLVGIETDICIDLEDLGNGYIQFHRSHAINTPIQAGPYMPSRTFDDDASYAMHRAIESLVDYYRDAVRNGYQPDASWLIEIPAQERIGVMV